MHRLFLKIVWRGGNVQESMCMWPHTRVPWPLWSQVHCYLQHALFGSVLCFGASTDNRGHTTVPHNSLESSLYWVAIDMSLPATCCISCVQVVYGGFFCCVQVVSSVVVRTWCRRKGQRTAQLNTNVCSLVTWHLSQEWETHACTAGNSIVNEMGFYSVSVN